MIQTAQQASQSAPPLPPPPIPPLPGASGGAQTGAGDAEQIIRDAVTAAEGATQTAGSTGQAPSIVQVSPDIPPEIVPIIGIIFGSVALMVIVTPIVRGIMRLIERQQDKSLVHGPAVAQQLTQLQQSIDTLAIEVERISEAQRFQSKVLAERDRPKLGEGSPAR